MSFTHSSHLWQVRSRAHTPSPVGKEVYRAIPHIMDQERSTDQGQLSRCTSFATLCVEKTPTLDADGIQMET